MKREIVLFTAAIMPFVFLSCTKESIPNQMVVNSTTTSGIEPAQTDVTEAAQRTAAAPVSSLKNSLTAMFEFNGNLKDKTGQLVDAKPNVPGGARYATDRKGVLNKAILFNGRYGLDILNVPTQPNSSVAVWVRYNAHQTSGQLISILYNETGPNFLQKDAAFATSISTPATTGTLSDPVNEGWHHLVATYDGSDLRFYVDGKFVGSTNNPVKFDPFTSTYIVGYSIVFNNFWQGCMDDLSFYNRTLSDVDVLQLFNM